MSIRGSKILAKLHDLRRQSLKAEDFLPKPLRRLGSLSQSIRAARMNSRPTAQAVRMANCLVYSREFVSIRGSQSWQKASFMFELPSPIHPAIVHFPIVLTLLGTLFSIFTFLTRRGALPQYTALILILAAGSAQYAVYTGNDQDPLFGTLPEEMRTLVREHSEWGERARTVVAIAAGLAVVALALTRAGAVRRVFAFLTLLGCLAASYCLLQAAQRGGKLVYEHRIGIHQGGTTQPAAAPTASPTAH